MSSEQIHQLAWDAYWAFWKGQHEVDFLAAHDPEPNAAKEFAEWCDQCTE